MILVHPVTPLSDHLDVFGHQFSNGLQGSSVGHSFEQLRLMIDHVHDQSRVGVCLDTCHMFAAGYDISTKAGYRNVMEQFGETVGWRYLKGKPHKASLGDRLK